MSPYIGAMKAGRNHGMARAPGGGSRIRNPGVLSKEIHRVMQTAAYAIHKHIPH